jgi:malate dehydrogenase (oxaloacetate-decarboxylating)(NADP+)
MAPPSSSSRGAQRLQVVGKRIDQVKLVVSGAGAAALACVDLLVDVGLPGRNVWLTDLVGVVWKGRTELMDPEKARFAQETDARTLAEVIGGADLFLGLSAGGVLKPEMVAQMAPRPLIFALANPTPEILPEEAKAVRNDAVIATRRTDYPNQVNNVLCFPFMFRGALDAGATTITRKMEIAAVHAIAGLARQEASEIVASAYGIQELSFGPEYLIPKPFDPRLIVQIAPAVAKAAMDSGVASRPIDDFDAYRQRLQQFVYHSGTLMKRIFAAARTVAPERSRIILCEGEDERVLRAAQIAVDEKLARPILVGRPKVIEQIIRNRACGCKLAKITPSSIPRTTTVTTNIGPPIKRCRRGAASRLSTRAWRCSPQDADRRHAAAQGRGRGLICGTSSTTARHLHYIDRVIGKRPGASVYAAMNALVLPNRQVFLVDTHVNLDPTAEQIAEITTMAADAVRRFGVEPKVALLSHSNFGSSEAPSALKMRHALALLRERAPELEVDGEMHGDSALDEDLRKTILPESTLHGSANLLVCPNLDAANIAYNLLKTAAGRNVAIGPVLLGCAAPAHILTNSATVRRIVNMIALTVVEANAARQM